MYICLFHFFLSLYYVKLETFLNEEIMKKQSLFRYVCGYMVVATFSACHEVSIEGSWVEPVSGMNSMFQGFKLESGGEASSINMATLQYKTWKKEGDRLILTGKSIGNHQTVSFSDTLIIESLSEDSLQLKKGGAVHSYSRMEQGQTEKTISVQGRLIIGHEVCTFTSDNDSIPYWIIDKTGKLFAGYDELTGGTKNGIPVYARLKVIDMGKSYEGFAANYKGVYHILEINELSLEGD